MLVLTRREGETLVIGKDVAIKLLRIDGGQVKIGIEAPKEVSIRRSELLSASELKAIGDF